MKVVKLNRNYRQFREHGHTVALRFVSYGDRARLYENTAKAVTQVSGWDRSGPFYAWFGKARYSHQIRPYFISFRNEQDLTMTLLKYQGKYQGK